MSFHELVSCTHKFLPPANEVWGKIIFSVVCVKNSVNRGICLSACWDTILREQTSQEQTPPRADSPPEQPPGSRYPPDQVPRGPGTPGADICPGADTPRTRHPQSRHPPPAQCMLGDTVNKQAVCILLEYNLVPKCFH